MHLKKYVSRVCNILAILWLKFMVHVMLFPIFPMINALYFTGVRAQCPLLLLLLLCHGSTSYIVLN